MAINARGFWRLLFVAYVLCGAITVGAAVVLERDALQCRDGMPAALSAHAAWSRLPPAERTWEPFVSDCNAAGEAIEIGLGALAAEAVILFGGATVVRWIYRGFLAPGN